MSFARRPTPTETERRRAVDRLLLAFVLAVSLVHVGRGLGRALAPRVEVEAPPPLAVDLATDPPRRLRLLPEIGWKRAVQIVEDRRAHGPIRRLEDLTRIRGIGPETVRRLVEAREVRVLVRGVRPTSNR